ncbi:MAG: NAD(P)/FAD-dependent oxidoreductase, partial [Candidatus Dormibacteraceae bacterium]
MKALLGRTAVAVGVGFATVLAARAISRARARSTDRLPIPYDSASNRVLILGGGFAGLHTARRLATLMKKGPGVALRLVDSAESMTFWPMVPEMITGVIQAAHVMRPLREELVGLGVEFINADVKAGDLDRRTIQTSAGEMGYDELVIAMGWKTAFFGTPGAREHCMTMESLADAVAIRNRVIEKLEAVSSGHRSDLEVVVVGGGSTGVE